MVRNAEISSPAIEEHLILVDEQDEAVGIAEKHAGHRAGLLHRAFSIFLFDKAGRLLLQRRAAGKYHSGGLWANACCGHPRPGETVVNAASRRLHEELGLATPLSFSFHARYRASLDNGMTENEFVHVLGGPLPPSDIAPNLAEVDAVELVSLDDLHTRVEHHPERYAYWLRCYLREHADEIAAMGHAIRNTVPPRNSPAASCLAGRAP